MTESSFPEGNAIVYCEGAFNTTNGKTAHGLVRRGARYRVLGVVDSRYAGEDAGQVLDGAFKEIPVFASVDEARAAAAESGTPATHLVVGLAPDGGRLPASARADVRAAIDAGLNVDSGLHDLLGDDPELSALAAQRGVTLRDIRRPPPMRELHFFTGKIEEVTSFRIALLGTDSAVGKRTTAWVLVEALREAGFSAELIGTGQTAWMQGARYSVVMDTLINDFVSGELEHITHRAWSEAHPDVLVIEGQGSLLNPAYPGGFEILAATRPDVVVLQHPPARTVYDGFPAYKLHPLDVQIDAIELVSAKPVVAITVSHEGLRPHQVPKACAEITEQTGLPAFDVLLQGADGLVDVLRPRIRREEEE